jgi:hypothetical protein
VVGVANNEISRWCSDFRVGMGALHLCFLSPALTSAAGAG